MAGSQYGAELPGSRSKSGMTTKNKGGQKLKEKEILIEKIKKPYQKPELVVHGSVEKITEQSLINREGFKTNAVTASITV